MPISDSAAMELAQLLGSGIAGELIPELVRHGLQALIEGKATAALGAERHQRTAERRGHRNGSGNRLLATPAGDVQLRIPRFRTGSFFPSLLEPRRRVDRALWAVVMEAYVSGVSTRKVDELVVALGCESGIAKSEVSRICQELDTQVQAFLRRLRERGLSGVQLVISDVHAGLKKSIARCCQGTTWQRCRVHVARNLLAKVPKGSQDMVAAALRSVFVQQDEPAVEQQWDQVITMLTETFPAAAA